MANVDYHNVDAKLFWRAGAFVWTRYASERDITGLLDQFGSPDRVVWGPFCKCGAELQFEAHPENELSERETCPDCGATGAWRWIFE